MVGKYVMIIYLRVHIFYYAGKYGRQVHYTTYCTSTVPTATASNCHSLGTSTYAATVTTSTQHSQLVLNDTVDFSDHFQN